jgi:hypothetical protein
MSVLGDALRHISDMSTTGMIRVLNGSSYILNSWMNSITYTCGRLEWLGSIHLLFKPLFGGPAGIQSLVQRKARCTPHPPGSPEDLMKLGGLWWDGWMRSQEYFFPILPRLYRRAKDRKWKSAFDTSRKRWAMKWRMGGHMDPYGPRLQLNYM